MTVHPGLYYVVPAEVFEDDNLEDSEKMLYALISGLSNNTGYCYASDNYLSERRKCDARHIRRMVLKLEEHGYVKRETIKKGMNWERKIFITHSSRKSYERTCTSASNGCTGPDRADVHSRIVSKVKIVREGINTGAPPPTPVLSPPSSIKKIEASQKALEMAQNLFSHVQTVNPKTKPPNLIQWAKTMDLMVSKDNRTWQEIEEVVKYAFDDVFWVKVLQSAEGLRKNFDKIFVKMKPVTNKGTNCKINEETAWKVKKVLQSENDGKSLMVYSDHATNQRNGDSINFDLPPETFEAVLLNWFGMRKK